MPLTKRKDGRYRKTLVDNRTGKTVYFEGRTEKEVFQKIMEYETKTKRGPSFYDLSEEWWSDVYDNLASQTVKSYKVALERARAFFTGQIKKITPKDVQIFFKGLARQGYARKTLGNQRTVINQIFDYAVVEGHIMYNPCSSVAMPPCAASERREAASSADERRVANSADVWLFPFIALYSGLRKGEILALQWRDIDFKNNTINVSKSVYHEGDRAYIKEPKTKRSKRIVPLTSQLKAELQKHKGKADDFVISDTGEKPLTNRRFLTLMRKYHEATGTKCTAHQLRHSFATIAIEQGADPKTVQELLGHKQISTTLDIYTDFRTQSVKKARSILDEAFTIFGEA